MKPSLLLALATSLSITLVTTASAQGPNPPGVNPQHYECYDVVDSIPRLAQKVELRDQFGASATVTARAMFLCNPVSKNNGRIRQAHALRVLRDPPGQIREVGGHNESVRRRYARRPLSPHAVRAVAENRGGTLTPCCLGRLGR
jgi:hypothetical protein